MNKYEAFLWLLNSTDKQLEYFMEAYYFHPDDVFPEFVWAYEFLNENFGQDGGILSIMK